MPKVERIESRLLVPFDHPDIENRKAQNLLRAVRSAKCGAKIGTTIAGSRGWAYPIHALHKNGVKVFVDTKAKDIPQTVADTAGFHIFPSLPFMVNIHASSGEASLDAFRARRNQVQKKEVRNGTASLLIAVTLLSSEDYVRAEFNGRSPLEQVLYYADLAADHEYDGVVCSGKELAILNARSNTKGLLKIVTGIRPNWAENNDQKRVVTPAKAMRLGADYLVVGRPITEHPSSVASEAQAIELILEEMEGSL